MKMIALIPAYEPDDRLITLLKELENTAFDAIVIDDGSGWKYQEIFDKAKNYATVLSHEKNRGKGAALKTGYEYIRDNYKEKYVIVTMDSDGQHTVQDATKLCEKLLLNPEKLIIGKRNFSKEVPLRSKFGNACTRVVYRLVTGIRVYDTQSGLRAFDNSLSDFMLGVKGQRYEYEMNVLMECQKNKIQIMEEDIETIYIDNNSSSHFNTLKDSFRIYKEILKFSAISARIISAVVNFTLNRKYVFKSNSDVFHAAIKYILLCMFILTINTAILGFLVEYVNIDKSLAKIITELSLFALSMAIQKMMIFKKNPITKKELI
jgi:gtrA family protein